MKCILLIVYQCGSYGAVSCTRWISWPAPWKGCRLKEIHRLLVGTHAFQLKSQGEGCPNSLLVSFPDPTPAGKRVWCTSSDFLGFQDVKQSCDINYCHGNALSGMRVAHATTQWPHLRRWCAVTCTCRESDWRARNQNCHVIKPKKSLKVHQTLFPV